MHATPGPCDKSSGECKEGCVEGHYGKKCTEDCPPNCDGPCAYLSGDCAQCLTGFLGAKCDSCADGKYGEKCDNTCSENGKDDDCDLSTGNCRDGCNEGFWANHCDTECGQCLAGSCDQASGECDEYLANFYGPKCDSCGAGKYGENCDNICSENCKDKACELATGNCLGGCNEGFWGNNSAAECGHCLAGSCDRDDGSCAECKPGFYNSLGDLSCSAECADGECEQSLQTALLSNGILYITLLSADSS